MSSHSVLIYGFVGGILPTLLRIAKSATSAELPDFYKAWWVWPATLVSGAIGPW